MELFSSGTVIRVAQPYYKFTKYQLIIHLKWVNFTACKLYLKNPSKVVGIFTYLYFCCAGGLPFYLPNITFIFSQKLIRDSHGQAQNRLGEFHKCLGALNSSLQSKS